MDIPPVWRSRGSRRVVVVLFAVCFATSARGREVTWESLGSNGQIVTSIAQASSSPGTLYASTELGVFRTDDGGAHWVAVLDRFPRQVASGNKTRFDLLVVDPFSALTAYVRADELSPDARPVSSGLYKTGDGGATWTLIWPTHVRAFAIDRELPTRLYATTEAGVIRSIDGGLRWTLVAQGLAAGLALGPAQTVYAGVGGGLLKSVDSAETWFPLPLPGNPPSFLAVSGGRLTTVYAITNNSSPFAGHLYFYPQIRVSRDAGKTWQTIFGDGLPYNYSWIRDFVAARTSPGTAYFLTFEGGVYRTLDGGSRWEEIGENLPANASAISLSPDGSTLYAGASEAGAFAANVGEEPPREAPPRPIPFRAPR